MPISRGLPALLALGAMCALAPAPAYAFVGDDRGVMDQPADHGQPSAGEKTQAKDNAPGAPGLAGKSARHGGGVHKARARSPDRKKSRPDAIRGLQKLRRAAPRNG